MESTHQDSSVIESVGIDDDSLYEVVSPNGRMMQANIKRNQKSTQTSFVTPVNIVKNNSECKINQSAESKNESLHNTSIYDSFSIESKYDSFDDSLNEEAHQKEINVSQFLSDQVNVTVRKACERPKFKPSYLCDSLEDICSLVSNAEHFSTSDEIENINNIFEKHGIYDDSLRNDICCDKKNRNSNEQYFDDDSLAIFEFEKTFDDSLEDANVASYVDSLILLRSSKGDAETTGEKFSAENVCAKNLFESSVPVIYENMGNPSVSDDESFKTAENLSSSVNSKSVSECHMSEDSLEEICDISERIPEVEISEDSDQIPLSACATNRVFPIKNAIEANSCSRNTTKAKIEIDDNEIRPKISGSPILKENKPVTHTKHIFNSNECFEINDSALSPDQTLNKSHSSDCANIEPKGISVDLNYLAEQAGMKVIRISDKFKEQHVERTHDCHLISSSLEQIETNMETNDEVTSSSICDGNEFNHLNDGTMIGTVMTIDTKYVIEECLKPPNTNKGILLNSHPKKRANLPSSTAGDFPLEDQSRKTIKVIKCTGMIDGKITTTYLDATPILNAFDGQEIKFQVMDFDVGSYKQESICLSNKCSDTTSQDLISPFSSQTEMKMSSKNVISPSNNQIEQNVSLSANPFAKNPEINAINIPDKEGLKLCIRLPDKKLKNINVNVSLREPVLQNKLCKSVGENAKIVHEKDTAPSSTLKVQTVKDAYIALQDKSDSLDKIMNEAQRKIPSLASRNADEVEISVINNADLVKCNIQMDWSLHNAPLLQALDLHDFSDLPRRGECLQSKDSIMPLNLCVRDTSSVKKKSSLALSDCKENLPLNLSSQAVTEIQKSKTPVKRKYTKQIVMDGEVKKSAYKSTSSTKIPVRKVDSALSTPLNQKVVKTELKTNSCSGKSLKNTNKKIAPDLLRKVNVEESPKKAQHFCMVRNSISKVPKSAQKPKSKRFQDIVSPVAKYIGTAKVSPLRTTHRYDPKQLVNVFSSPDLIAKAANKDCIMSPQKSSTTKPEKKFKS